MAIQLAKTLQTIAYTFYIKCNVAAFQPLVVVLEEKAYQSAGHYTDGFVPMIVRREIITDATVVADFNASYWSDEATSILAVETFLLTQAWYTGGSIVA